MYISPKNSSQQATEPADEWLKNEGYYRKTLPKDSTCLFRGVSEQIYMTQYYHFKVRKECVEFMRENKELFEENIAVPMENYLTQMSCFTEWGGINEIQAMSNLYRCDFIIFYCQKKIKKNVTNNGYDRLIYLCHTAPQQFETVYEKKFIKTAAYCQSIVYQTLYKDVFQMSDIDDTIENMLHDRTANIRHDKFFLKGNISVREELTNELFNKIGNVNENTDEIPKANTLFSYRVAKALDSNIYRNIDLDIWHELKREMRRGAWIGGWNNAELQVGGKCYVELDYPKNNNYYENNKKFKDILCEKNNDNNGNVIRDNNNETIKKESLLFFGHIQEMSKNEGPVVVFIEEFGEKKTVPYSSLKPLPEQRKIQLSSVNSSTTHRKNSSFDHINKLKKQWNSNTRKTKDFVNTTGFTSLDRINNNRSNSNWSNDNTKNISNKNTDWSENSNVKTIPTQLKSYTDTDNKYSTEQQYSMDTVEVQPLSVVLVDNTQTLNPTDDSKEYFCKDTSTSVYNKNQTELHDKPLDSNINNNNNNSDNNNNNTGNNIVQLSQQSTLPMSNETFYPPHSKESPPTMYSGNLNVMCVSPDGNVYAPISFFGGNVGSPSALPAQTLPPSATNVVDHANQVVNLGVQTSVDVNGTDLPYTDIPTLRFFFNLGIECFHNNHMWSTSNSPMAFASSYNNQNNTVLPLPTSEVPPSNENIQQPVNNLSNIPRSYQSQNRRKNDQPFNRSNSYGNPKSTHPRMDTRQDSTKNKNETSHHSSNDYQKSKSYLNSESHRDYNNGNWDSRKNNNQGRFKKNNDGRNRNDRSIQYHHEYQPRSYNNHLDNNNNDFGKSEMRNFQKNKSDAGHQVQQINPPPFQMPIPASSPPFHQHMNQPSAAMYTSVPYYTNELDNYFPPNTNIYPVSYVAHPDSAESANNPNTYMCSSVDNYPQSVSPIYAPITYPPPPLYSTISGANPHDSWYTIPGGQTHYIPYLQLPVSQQQQQHHRHHQQLLQQQQQQPPSPPASSLLSSSSSTSSSSSSSSSKVASATSLMNTNGTLSTIN